MAVPVSNRSDCWSAPEVYKHHEQRRVCISRPKYREGRKAKAVKEGETKPNPESVASVFYRKLEQREYRKCTAKELAAIAPTTPHKKSQNVYTINLESRYLMVQGVPAIGVMTELIQLCALYGVVEEYRPLDEYPAEEFTEVYLVKFQKLTSARAAKRNMDEKSFYGGVLHVCYVPEYETVEDTRLKLQDRRSYIARAARSRAKQREKTEAAQESSASSEAPTSSDKIPASRDVTSKIESTGEALSQSHYSEFPPLPLPPREQCSFRQKSHRRLVPTEDKMGTLHNAFFNVEQWQADNLSSNPTISNREQGTEGRLGPNPGSGVRFIPRNTNLESRKRKVEESGEPAANVSGENEPLIGPKLPEPAKLDMEDESLNTTVSLIRSTMKQVGSVPDLKRVEKKAKPRRRI